MLYQFLPRLSDEEYRALEASIAEHGIQVPILVDEHKAIIDGHHRKEIADRLGIDCPRRFAIDLTDEQKRTLALSLNLDRRHLSREQKRELVERSLKADPGLSDRQHAERTGVSPTTVGSARSRLEESGDVSNLDTRTDSAGRTQPASKPKSPEPADLGEGDAGSGQHSTEASPADDVDTQAASAEDEAPGAMSDDATAATGGSQGLDSLRLSEALDRYPELQHYADRGDTDSVIRLAGALDGYGISERHHRRELLARTIAADLRRETEPETDEGPDPVDVVEEMFDLANAFNQRVTSLGGPEAVATAMGHATPLEADLWRDEFAALITTATDLHAATTPTIRRIK
jgi:ParB-like chromosome segregation protein Spo0J